jgi:hypothetical protein
MKDDELRFDEKANTTRASTGVVGVSGMAGIVIVAYLALSFVVVHGLLLASAGRGGVTRGRVDRRPVSLDHLAMFHLAVEADELVVVSARDVGGFRGRLHRGRRCVLLLRDVSPNRGRHRRHPVRALSAYARPSRRT